jgi:hypothetical protein
MSRSLQKVGNYPTLTSRASQALRPCRLRFTVQQSSGGLMIRHPSARPHPRRSRSARMAAIRLSTFVYQFTHARAIDISIHKRNSRFCVRTRPKSKRALLLWRGVVN